MAESKLVCKFEGIQPEVEERSQSYKPAKSTADDILASSLHENEPVQTSLATPSSGGDQANANEVSPMPDQTRAIITVMAIVILVLAILLTFK